MASHADDELVAEETAGFKLGQKKTMAEINKLDEDDDAMQRYKASLGINSGKDISDKNDPRLVIIHALAIEVPGRPDIEVKLGEGGMEKLKNHVFKVKEGATFRMKATFQVQHEVLSGLKYLQVVKRKGIPISKEEEMIGSFAPSTDQKPRHEVKFPEETAPTGMLARGTYKAVSKFIDDDKVTHLQFDWQFEIVKEWEK